MALGDKIKEKDEKPFIPRWKRILSLPMDTWLWSIEKVKNEDDTEGFPYRFERAQIQWSDQDDESHKFNKPLYFRVASQKKFGISQDFYIDFIRLIGDGAICSLMKGASPERKPF